jgi:hypothetical protein
VSEKRKKLRLTQPSPKSGQHIVVQEPSDDVNPMWCFSHLQSEWNVAELQKDEKIAFLEHLVRRSQLTWKQIKLLPREGLGPEAISGDSIKAGIPSLAAGEVILCFRMNQVGRFLGVRKDSTFHVLWIDCKFELYKH